MTFLPQQGTASSQPCLGSKVRQSQFNYYLSGGCLSNTGAITQSWGILDVDPHMKLWSLRNAGLDWHVKKHILQEGSGKVFPNYCHENYMDMALRLPGIKFSLTKMLPFWFLYHQIKPKYSKVITWLLNRSFLKKLQLLKITKDWIIG